MNTHKGLMDITHNAKNAMINLSKSEALILLTANKQNNWLDQELEFAWGDWSVVRLSMGSLPHKNGLILHGFERNSPSVILSIYGVSFE